MVVLAHRSLNSLGLSKDVMQVVRPAPKYIFCVGFIGIGKGSLRLLPAACNLLVGLLVLWDHSLGTYSLVPGALCSGVCTQLHCPGWTRAGIRCSHSSCSSPASRWRLCSCPASHLQWTRSTQSQLASGNVLPQGLLLVCPSLGIAIA